VEIRSFGQDVIAMPVEIKCPNCGEEDRSRMKPRREGGDRIVITCESCGTSWERNPDVCPRCGAGGLSPIRMPLYQKARGTQQSIIGFSIARECNECGWQSGGPPQKSAF
jgi:predicted RNA-binding Zn-ribbon protein involved in translation (DUF1610 family)